jgi:hypothetical protein
MLFSFNLMRLVSDGCQRSRSATLGALVCLSITDVDRGG